MPSQRAKRPASLNETTRRRETVPESSIKIIDSGGAVPESLMEEASLDMDRSISRIESNGSVEVSQGKIFFSDRIKAFGKTIMGVCGSCIESQCTQKICNRSGQVVGFSSEVPAIY